MLLGLKNFLGLSMVWNTLYDYSTSDGIDVWYNLVVGGIEFYLSKDSSNEEYPEWILGIPLGDMDPTIIRRFECPDSELAKQLGLQHLKEHLLEIIKEIS